MKTIYIAGPLYTEGDRFLLEKIDNICKQAGFNTYLPHRDGGLFIRCEESSRKFFINDLEKLDEISIIIVVLNGSDVDSGTSWEIGYSFSKNKIIIGYIEDSRIYEYNKQLNPMISNSLNKLVKNIEELKMVLMNSNIFTPNR